MDKDGPYPLLSPSLSLPSFFLPSLPFLLLSLPPSPPSLPSSLLSHFHHPSISFSPPPPPPPPSHQEGNWSRLLRAIYMKGIPEHLRPEVSLHTHTYKYKHILKKSSSYGINLAPLSGNISSNVQNHVYYMYTCRKHASCTFENINI